MAEAYGDRSKRVAALAGRLRVLQSELADEEPKVREEQLVAVIDQTIAAEQAHDVPGFLDELLTWFPTFGDGAAAAPGPAVRAKAPEPKSPAEWVSGLVQAWQQLPQAEREALTTRLIEGGVIQPTPAGVQLTPAIEQDLRAKLSLMPGEKIDPAKVLALAAVLVDFVVFCDALAWRLWAGNPSSIAPPGTDVRQNAAIAKFMGNFVKGADVNLPGLGLTPELQRLQQLIRAVMAGISEVGRVYGELLSTVLSPESIKATVGTGFTKGKAEYWDMFEARAAKTLDRDEIKREIRLAIGRFVEDSMKRFNR
ncbi:MAG: hypothetical protein AMXMBFR58_14200 [Phycisphaerae bacterium]